MKLLIDIPEDAFNDCKLCCENRVAIWQEEIIAKGIPYEEIPQDKWIPIKTRKLTEEEKEEYPDYSFMYDCKLPEDGEEVLVTTFSGMVTLDTFYRDDGCYFECYCDEGDVIAWQSKPESYKGETEENGNNSN